MWFRDCHYFENNLIKLKRKSERVSIISENRTHWHILAFFFLVKILNHVTDNPNNITILNAIRLVCIVERLFRIFFYIDYIINLHHRNKAKCFGK